MFNFPLAPPSASNFAAEHDAIFYVLCFLTGLFTLIVCSAAVFFAIKYRAGTKVDRSRPVYEDLRLELTWTIIPLILGLVVFFFGARLYIEMRTPPKDAEEVYVIGKQWMWHIQHPNGVRENNTLHVPVDKPVRLTMISQDVIHAFYIPAFRNQFMVVPGRYTTMWFTPTKVGEYHLFCNMYCGTQHSEMGGKVVVMDQRDYANWLANGGQSVAPLTMEQAGQKLYSKIGCNNCHGGQDSVRAPSLNAIYGKPRQFSNAAPQAADDAYLRESILRPYNKLTNGYGETMPAYENQLSEEDVLNLISYIKTMGTSPVPPAVAGMSRREATNRTPGNDSRNSLAVNAMRANTEDPDATPTVRDGAPSVGAIAAGSRSDRE